MKTLLLAITLLTLAFSASSQELPNDNRVYESDSVYVINGNGQEQLSSDKYTAIFDNAVVGKIKVTNVTTGKVYNVQIKNLIQTQPLVMQSTQETMILGAFSAIVNEDSASSLSILVYDSEANGEGSKSGIHSIGVAVENDTIIAIKFKYVAPKSDIGRADRS